MNAIFQSNIVFILLFIIIITWFMSFKVTWQVLSREIYWPLTDNINKINLRNDMNEEIK